MDGYQVIWCEELESWVLLDNVQPSPIIVDLPLTSVLSPPSPPAIVQDDFIFNLPAVPVVNRKLKTETIASMFVSIEEKPIEVGGDENLVGFQPAAISSDFVDHDHDYVLKYDKDPECLGEVCPCKAYEFHAYLCLYFLFFMIFNI